VASELEKARVRDSSIYAAIGHALLFTGDFKESLAYSKRALEIDPKFFKALVNASTACRLLDQIDEAYSYAQQAHELEPDNAKPLGALAAIHISRGQTSQGLVRAAYAIRLDPECLDAISAIASAYSRVGDMEMALPFYDKYLAKMPFDAGIASGRLFTLHYKTGITREELRSAHKEWGDRFGAQFKSQWPKHENERTINRKLKIGYISGDFRHHVVGYWTKHIIEGHDKSRFEIFCFANNKEDQYSEKFKAAADHWIPILDKSDEEVTKIIRDAKIDILVDLSGHTSGHRLLVMARKPAPVQATWCGYIDSTGLEAVDYVITDAVTAPPTEPSPFVEEPLQLKTGSACFDQIPDVAPVGPLPYYRKGYFTFGCFNNPSKIGPEVVALWAEILKAAPGSRLMLTYGNLDDVFTRERLVRLFNEHGIDEDRLQFRKGSRKATLQAYTDEIDLALDTFPYTGGTTTCEALWMGVPVVALYGEFPISRYSCGLLTYAGLTGLTANSKTEYVERTLHLFRNLETVAYLRSNLRQHLMNTPLFNSTLFMKGLEEAYIQVFENWCKAQAPTEEPSLVTA
jgi:predicted O-linked N-acetylglucosamine transferase (SPINDLY family)